MVICLIIYEAENMKLVSAALTNILSSGRLSKLVMRDFPGVLFLSPPKPATHARVCACTRTRVCMYTHTCSCQPSPPEALHLDHNTDRWEKWRKHKPL